MLRLTEMVRIGEIFEVRVGNVCVHTKLQEMHGDDELIVLQPTLMGKPVKSNDGIFQFSFFRPNGVYQFNARLASAYDKGDMKLCRFLLVTEMEKIQRRQYYRLPVALDVVMETEGDAHKYRGISTTLSENSVQVSCLNAIPKETRLTAKIFFSATETIVLKGMVYKCTGPLEKNGLYDIVILFADNNERHITRLSRYILKQQIIARNK